MRRYMKPMPQSRQEITVSETPIRWRLAFMLVVTLLLFAASLRASAEACTATTTVPEFKDRIQEACDHPGAVQYVKSFEVTGDRKVLRVTMTMQATLTGQQMAA